jgi:hypothetical protein
MKFSFKKLIGFVFLIVLVLVVKECNDIANSLCSKEVILIKSSPNGLYDAVILQGNCGATTSYSYKIYIIKKVKKLKNEHLKFEVFISDHVENLKISWESSKKLLITYDEARIFKYRNFYYIKDNINNNLTEFYISEIKNMEN